MAVIDSYHEFVREDELQPNLEPKLVDLAPWAVPGGVSIRVVSGKRPNTGLNLYRRRLTVAVRKPSVRMEDTAW
jgi:hypothetical protein